MRPQTILPGCMVVGVILALTTLSWAGDSLNHAPATVMLQCDSTPLRVAEAKGYAAPSVASGQTSGVVQKPVVRRPTTGMPPGQLRQEVEQAIVEGSRIRAKPGYTIQVLPNGEGVLSRKKNDAPGTGIKCLCMGAKASGRCKLVTSGSSSADCVSDGCTNGYCGVRLGPPSKSLMQ